MGRWTQYDEDEYRLPEGMRRVGYDADTQKYTFEDENGDLWEGPEGAEYGEMTRVGRAPARSTNSGNDIEAAAPTRNGGYKPLSTGDPDTDAQLLHERNRSAWRQLLPFFLIVIVVLLLVFRLSPSMSKPRTPSCPEDSRPYTIKAGDTCWAISKDFGTTLEKLRSSNPQVDCASLQPGQHLCVPISD